MSTDSCAYSHAHLEHLIKDIHRILQQNSPKGISEYDLLQELRGQDSYGFLSADIGDTHALFGAHFILSHALYQLRDILRQKQEAIIDIGPLLITLLPYQSNTKGLETPDSLREYYLDFFNLEQTTSEDVNELIASFWLSMHRFEHRDEALAELGLSDPVDDETIKRTYKKLVMEHHPDRGGDKQRLQAINSAMGMLLKTRKM